MTVSLDYDPESHSQGGISRLRRLASFGRYGADVHASARRSCSAVSADQSKNNTTDYSLLAASLSSFYGWVAKQTGNRVVLGDSNIKREQKLHVTQRARAVPKAAASPPPAAVELASQHPHKTAGKPAKRQQHVQLPSVFTMQGHQRASQGHSDHIDPCPVQGVSAYTSCFDSLSYRTSDNRRVHGLVQSSKHLQAVPVYMEDSVDLLIDNRARMSRQPRNTAISPVISHPRHHGSRTSKLHAQPAVKASNSGPCSEAHQCPQCFSPDSAQLSAHQPAEAQQLAPSPSKKEYQEAQHEADSAQQERPEAHVVQQTFLPRSPHTARSSQSDATHLDHHDSYRSDSSCQDACQSAQAAVDADPNPELYQQQASAQQHPPIVDAALPAGDSSVFQHEMRSHRPPPVPGCIDSLLGRTSPDDAISDRKIMSRQSFRARQGRQGPRRALADITNTVRAAGTNSIAAQMVKDNGRRVTASVPDLVTFWELRASLQQQ
ncbi:hypothetical protein ABBQ38_005350 [Trebouxia sp. C0009 RCD-2024]